MVSPDLLGASAGACFGAALGILLSFGSVGVEAAAFVVGVVAVLASYGAFERFGRRMGGVLVLVLSGLVVGNLFQAFTSAVKFLADPNSQLPEITFWLMGGLSSVREATSRVGGRVRGGHGGHHGATLAAQRHGAWATTRRARSAWTSSARAWPSSAAPRCSRRRRWRWPAWWAGWASSCRTLRASWWGPTTGRSCRRPCCWAARSWCWWTTCAAASTPPRYRCPFSRPSWVRRCSCTCLPAEEDAVVPPPPRRGPDAAAGAPALEVSDLACGYGGRPRSRRRVVLSRPWPRARAVGPQWRGKDHAVQDHAGVPAASGGDVLVEGEEARGWTRRRYARSVAYVPQTHESAFGFTVREMVLMGRTPSLDGFAGPRRDDERIADARHRRLGLSALADRDCTTLSGASAGWCWLPGRSRRSRACRSWTSRARTSTWAIRSSCFGASARWLRADLRW